MATILPYIPETITVHLGAPDEDAPNVTLPFPDYIKNVASSEIYPTWPESALRANILAQISFALNRVYTEYYRSRGYDFDITNSTAYDQSFINGRNIFASISRVVDEIFNDYLRRENFVEPLFALYCNGTTVTCNGLSQWGSVDLAEDGQNSVEIVRYYYGDDVEIVVGAPVRGITSSVPIRLLRLGTTGNDVLSIQTRLNRISVNYPSIPKIPDTDGFFGIETENAVKEFQSIFDLDVDGIVGKATWYRIQQIYAGVKRLNELNSEGVLFDEIPSQFPESLSLGADGIGVSYIQYMLNYVAQYDPAIESVDLSGRFDEQTETAVKAFQTAYGLPDTGVVNDRTYARLFDVYNSIILSLPPELFENTARPFPGFIVALGFSGEFVSDLQRYLQTISAVIPEIPSPEITGTFDEATENSVRAVQRLYGITENGRANLPTWQAISELYNDIRASETRSPEQFPGYIIE